MVRRAIRRHLGSRRRRLSEESAGNAAVEFALVAPIFLLIVLGSVAYGHLFWMHHELQQLTAEAARSAVAGLSDTERDQIARSFVAQNLPVYSSLDARKLQVSTVVGTGSANTFQVTIQYDLSDSLAYRLGNLLPLPQSLVQQSAVIQRGGY